MILTFPSAISLRASTTCLLSVSSERGCAPFAICFALFIAAMARANLFSTFSRQSSIVTLAISLLYLLIRELTQRYDKRENPGSKVALWDFNLDSLRIIVLSVSGNP